MSSTDFRDALARMDLTQSGFARLLRELGDDRPWPTILRTVQELARADRTAPLPWSVGVLLQALQRMPAGS